MGDLILTLQQEKKELETLVNTICLMHQHTKRQADGLGPKSSIYSGPGAMHQLTVQQRRGRENESAQLSIHALSSAGPHRSIAQSGGAPDSISQRSMSQMDAEQLVPQLDAESVSVLHAKVKQKQASINQLVERIKQNIRVRQVLKEERQKAKEN